MSELPRPPAGLRAASRRIWDMTVAEFGLTPGELSTLEEVCRCKDEAIRLEKAVRALPELVVRGSTGQPKAHPLLEELRRHRALLAKLTAELALPQVDQGTGMTAAQLHAQRAARARWDRVKGVS